MQRQSQTHRRHLRAVRGTLPPPSRPGRRPWRKLLLALTALGALAAGGFWLSRSRPIFVPETVSVRHGSVEVAVETDALVVRTERVYAAPSSGGVKRVAAEGQRVRVGSPVVAVEGTQVVAENAGLVSYQVDGLEASLSTAQVAKWEPAWFKALPAPSPRPIADGRAEAGAPLFKVVDNFSQALVTLVNLEAMPPVDEGTTVRIRFPGWGGATSEGRIARIAREGSEALLYLTAPTFPEALSGVRKASVSVVFDSFTGLVVPRTAIDVRGGRQGVWVLEGATPVFIPAKVLGGNVSEVVLEADLSPGARVVRTAPTHMD